MNIIKTVCEIIGDPVPTGYSLEGTPIFLNEDDTTTYPQIRITPLIDEYDINEDKYIDIKMNRSIIYYKGVFQIDIYAQKIPQVKKIKKAIDNRIYHFFNLEFLELDSNDFIYNNETGYYHSLAYANVEDNPYKNVVKLKINNNLLSDWYSNEDGLFVRLDEGQKVEDIKIVVLLRGRQFSNGELVPDRNIYAHQISRTQQLSDLEDNEVERISFDLDLVFSEEFRDNDLPILDKTGVKYNG